MKHPYRSIRIRLLRIFVLVIGVIFGFVTQVVAQYGAPSANYSINGKVIDCKTKTTITDYSFEYSYGLSAYRQPERTTKTDSLGNFHIWFDVDIGQSAGQLKIKGENLTKFNLNLENPVTWKTFTHEILLEYCKKTGRKQDEPIDTTYTEPDIFEPEPNINYSPPVPPMVETKQPERKPVFDQNKEFIYLKPKHSWASELRSHLLDSNYQSRAIGTYAYTQKEEKKEFYIEDVSELKEKFPKQFAEAFPDWEYVITTFSKYSKDRK